jgi:hypothetical protein
MPGDPSRMLHFLVAIQKVGETSLVIVISVDIDQIEMIIRHAADRDLAVPLMKADPRIGIECRNRIPIDIIARQHADVVAVAIA